MSEISQECRDSFAPVDSMTDEQKDLMRRAWNLYERCRRYSGRHIHDICCLAGRLLNYAYCLQAWCSGKPDDAAAEKHKRHCAQKLKENVEDGLKRFGKELP